MTPRAEQTAKELTADNFVDILGENEAAKIEEILRQKISSAKDLSALKKIVMENPQLQEAFGDELEQAFDTLVERVQAKSAGKDFRSKVETKKESKTALQKVKDVAMFPIRHPIATAAILLAALGVAYFGMGNLMESLKKLHGFVSDKVISKLKTLDTATGALRPGMGPGMEKPGGGGSAPGLFDFKFTPATGAEPLHPELSPAG